MDLFTPIVPEQDLNPYFKIIKDGPAHKATRKMMSELAHHLKDIDGNFVKEFQTKGFDARIWELFLFAFFKEEKFLCERSYNAPDFLINKYGKEVAVEAVIVGQNNDSKPIELEKPDPFPRSSEEIKILLINEVPIKFSSTLTSKLNRKTPYWELPHVKGRPFILAFADFHEPREMVWSYPAVAEYLYGIMTNLLPKSP